MTNPERRRLVDRFKTIEERLLIVVNPMSRKGSELASRIRSLIRREGMDLEETATDHPDDMGSTLSFWSKRFGGSRVIMVFGGDGAINQVINNIMLSRSNKNVVLVPIPAGTANDFCRAMGLASVEEALGALVEFNIQPVDLIRLEIDGDRHRVKYCSNIIGLGLDGDLANRSLKYKRFGVPGYWYASLKRAAVVIFKGMDVYRVKITTDSFEYRGKLMGLIAANISKYARSFKIAPGAKPDDGKLYMTVIKPMSGIKSLVAALSVTWGLHSRFKAVHTFTCENAEIELMDDIYAQEDGEVILYPSGTRFRISIERGAINVLSGHPDSRSE